MTVSQTITITIPRPSKQRGSGVTARYNRISFRLSDRETEALHQIVAERGMTQSDFLAQIVNEVVTQLCKK